jgi:hypothetical protein
MVAVAALADFGVLAERAAGEKNGLERVESGCERADWPIGEVRKPSQEPALTGGNWRQWTNKKPNR